MSEEVNSTEEEWEAPVEGVPVESVDEEPPAEERRGWVVGVLTVIGILMLCCILAVCITAAIAAFGDGDEAAPTLVPPVEATELPPAQATPMPPGTATPTPPAQPTATPTSPAQPTATPIQPYLQIDEPGQGAVLDISRPVLVRGIGTGLPEGQLVVEAIDRNGTLLARQPTTLQGPDVGVGGQGTWQVELQIQTELGMTGRILAYAQSPQDGSTIAQAVVDVTFGSAPTYKPWLKIQEPEQDAVLDITRPVTVSGTGGGLPDGALAVQAFDELENLLVEVPTTLQGPDVENGGDGTWKVRLTIPAEAGTPGLIVAIARSPADGSRLTEDWIDVVFGPVAEPR